MELLEKDKDFIKKYKYMKILITVFDVILLLVDIFAIDWMRNRYDINELSLDTTHDKIYVFLTLLLLFYFLWIVLTIVVGYHIVEKINCSKYHISKQEAKSRHDFMLYDIKYVPLLQRFAKLNPDAKSSQTELFKEWFGLDDDSISEYFFNRECSEEDWNDAANQLKEKELASQKEIINSLFQFVILDDGIHKDEWNLLMQLMVQIQFNKHYINYFKERYEPLRTEFDEYEKRSNNSGNKYEYSLKEYYTTLGLEENASYEEVRRAYHELALQHHPDLPKNASRIEECEKMMMKINEAYEKLRSKS